MQKLISLISDTETRPTPQMRQAIANAEVGDEQRGEDPSVTLLQERVAELLGKEAALWFPGGTMCNFVAVRVHTQPADAVICDRMAHIVRAESAGIAMSSGVLLEHIPTERGIFTPAELDAALSRLRTVGAPYGAPATLLCVEQTHNFGGGAVWSHEELAAVSRHARSNGLATHMDGARLMNACTATGTSAAAFGSLVDSVWIDFTKGLGAPIGAVLAGSRDFIAEARRQKHIFAGAMRQAGIAAAGCLYALDHHVERLVEDHANAQKLATGLQAIDGIHVRTAVPESNMVFFTPALGGLTNREFLALLQEYGVRMGEVRGEIRAVTHLDVSPTDIDCALSAIRKIVDAAKKQKTSRPAALAPSLLAGYGY
ncbi:threonine aldolase family protein [Undibacterium sp. TJN25]|uniref:threonine aldolase family protein n=1 Tax=Undibacterium sp. TJN25 TaxID=3413056 RepID=UPI003BF1E793